MSDNSVPAAEPRIDSSEVIAVAERECGEELVDLCDSLPILLASQANPPLTFGARPPVLARIGVAVRLRRAISRLPRGTGCVIVAAFRSRSQQQRLYNRRLRAALQSSGRTPGETVVHLRQYVADPTIYAPHTTGGAFDVLLVGPDRVLLDMGGSFTADHTARTGYPFLSARQQSNRALLVDVMGAEGFVNYPFEWWHWSYGEKYWGLRTGREAIYAPVTVRGVVRAVLALQRRRLGRRVRELTGR